MTLYIDGSRLGNPTPTGVEIYSEEIIPRICAYAKEHNIEVKLLVQSKKSFDVPQIILRGKFMWSLISMSIFFLTHRKKGDILFVPSHILPIIGPSNSYVTIHDLAWKHFPRAYSFKEKMLLSFSTIWAKVFAKQIITISPQTKTDLIKFYKVPESKIEVIPLGVAKDEIRNLVEKDPLWILNKHNLTQKKYLLYLGRIETKKNVGLMIRAFYASKISQVYSLVLIGKPGVGYENVISEIKDDRVRDLGYLSKEEAYTLLSQSAAFVFPSLYEGFGMPVLEALSLGVPVISSNAASLPFVGGKFVTYFDPTNEKELTNIFDHFEYKELPKGVEEHLKQFSWESTALQIIKTLHC